jgi:hypothetical protein
VQAHFKPVGNNQAVKGQASRRCFSMQKGVQRHPASQNTQHPAFTSARHPAQAPVTSCLFPLSAWLASSDKKERISHGCTTFTEVVFQSHRSLGRRPARQTRCPGRRGGSLPPPKPLTRSLPAAAKDRKICSSPLTFRACAVLLTLSFLLSNLMFRLS